jgi:drug/metabolite transporter (DMT)-like permease
VNPVLPALALAVNALVWGVSWWPFRELQARGLHPLWATAIVFIFSLACVVIARPQAWRGFAGRPLMWLLMLATGLTNTGFNWAVTEGDVVRVVLLFYLMPAWSVMLVWPLLGEKPTAASLLRVALALAGVAVVLKAPGMEWPVPQGLADWLAVAGGFSFALTSILLRRMDGAPTDARVLAMFLGGAVVGTAVAMLGVAQGFVAPLPAPAWPWILIASVLAVGFMASNLALQYGASRLPAHSSSLIMLSEVIFASLSSAAVGAGEISQRSLAGGALILLAAVLSAWPQKAAAH